MDIVIAGGGVAGLEALLALRDLAGSRAHITLIAPDPDFTYKPLAVAEPFALGSAHRVPLRTITNAAGAELVLESLTEVDDAAGEVQLGNHATCRFDALLVAPGARAVAGLEGATTWWPGGDADVYGGLLRDIEEGYSKRVAVVVPPGAVWPLPAYELALMTAGEAGAMGHDDVEIVVVTPEPAPLTLFGEEAGAALTEELERAGVQLRTGCLARMELGRLVLDPGGELLDVQRVFSIPRLVGPAVAGLPCDAEAFILAGDDGRVERCERTWAAGDGVASPVKFGGVATHQARVAVTSMLRAAGFADLPDPGEPVLQGRLLLGGSRTRRLRGRGNGVAAPLWWPSGKVAGEHLPRWLAEHGETPGAAASGGPEGGVEVDRTLTALRAVEARYVRELARR